MLSIGQATTHLGTVTALCTMPPGPCQVVLGCDPASSATAYIGITPGTGGTFSSSNGIPIAVVQVDYDSVGVDMPEDVARVEKVLSHR